MLFRSDQRRIAVAPVGDRIQQPCIGGFVRIDRGDPSSAVALANLGIEEVRSAAPSTRTEAHLLLTRIAQPGFVALHYNLRPGHLFADRNLRLAMQLCVDLPRIIDAATDLYIEVGISAATYLKEVGHASGGLAAALAAMARDVEARHDVRVEVVTVGDAPLDDALQAVVAAAREAQAAAEQRLASGEVPPPASVVIDVTEATFQTEVIDRSFQVPVVIHLAPCHPLSRFLPLSWFLPLSRHP